MHPQPRICRGAARRHWAADARRHRCVGRVVVRSPAPIAVHVSGTRARVCVVGMAEVSRLFHGLEQPLDLDQIAVEAGNGGVDAVRSSASARRLKHPRKNEKWTRSCCWSNHIVSTLWANHLGEGVWRSWRAHGRGGGALRTRLEQETFFDLALFSSRRRLGPPSWDNQQGFTAFPSTSKRCGTVWCGVVRCGVVRCGGVWCGGVWCGVVWCGVVWCGVVGCGVLWSRLHVLPLRCMPFPAHSNSSAACPKRMRWSDASPERNLASCTHVSALQKIYRAEGCLGPWWTWYPFVAHEGRHSVPHSIPQAPPHYGPHDAAIALHCLIALPALPHGGPLCAACPSTVHLVPRAPPHSVHTVPCVNTDAMPSDNN